MLVVCVMNLNSMWVILINNSVQRLKQRSRLPPQSFNFHREVRLPRCLSWCCHFQQNADECMGRHAVLHGTINIVHA